MRRFLTLSGALVALPLLLVPSRASAHEEDYEPEYDEHRKPEIGVSLEAYRSSPAIGMGPGVNGGYLGMHARLGRRIALGFGLDQGYGDDPSGWKRFDIAWNLPKLYVYLNPKSKTQLYMTTGLDMRVSHFEDAPDKPLPSGTPWGFFYFGSFLGGGIEHRLDKSMTLRIETRWFVRGRASGKGPNAPPLDEEFSKQTAGQRGGILTVGLTFF